MKIKKEKFDEIVQTFGYTKVLPNLSFSWSTFFLACTLGAKEYTFAKLHPMMEFLGLEEEGMIDIDAVQKFLGGGFNFYKKLPWSKDEGFTSEDLSHLVEMLKEAATPKPAVVERTE